MDKVNVIELRESWRQKRVQRLISRLQRKHKDQGMSFSNKILGINSNNGKLAPPAITVDRPTKSSTIPSKRPPSASQPKIIPRETKLSMQRKSMLDPNYKMKMFLERKSMVSFGSSLNVSKLSETLHDNSRVNGLTSPKTYLHDRSVHSMSIDPNKDIAVPTFGTLVKGLDSWLKKRGKHFNSFKSLKTLATTDLSPILETEDKENSASGQLGASSSVISLEINDSLEEKKNQKEMDLKVIAIGAIEDLCTLVRMGYPVNKCETWLNTILNNYPDLKNYPLYWECRASINTKIGIKQEPVVQVSQIDDFVSKFKHLNLSTLTIEVTPDVTSIKKSRVLQEVNVENVLPSSSIQFAVTKKNEQDENILVTPVRRSARKTKCPANHNKDMNCVRSLLDLSPELRQKMKFEPNTALL